MGKPETDRTQQLHAAARRYTVAQQANRAIEQHNFDKLIRQGTVVLDTAGATLLSPPWPHRYIVTGKHG